MLAASATPENLGEMQVLGPFPGPTGNLRVGPAAASQAPPTPTGAQLWCQAQQSPGEHQTIWNYLQSRTLALLQVQSVPRRHLVIMAFLIVTTQGKGKGATGFSGLRPRTLLHILQCTGQTMAQNSVAQTVNSTEAEKPCSGPVTSGLFILSDMITVPRLQSLKSSLVKDRV